MLKQICVVAGGLWKRQNSLLFEDILMQLPAAYYNSLKLLSEYKETHAAKKEVPNCSKNRWIALSQGELKLNMD